MERSKYHYRFDCRGQREILLIGDWTYAAKTSDGFDPDGVRYGAVPIMSKVHWDEIEQWTLRESSDFTLVDTTLLFKGE